MQKCGKIEQFMSYTLSTEAIYIAIELIILVYFSNGDVKSWFVMIHFMFDRRLIQIGQTFLDLNAFA